MGKLLLTEYVSANESSVHLSTLPSGEVKSLTPQDAEKTVPRGREVLARWPQFLRRYKPASSRVPQLVQIDLTSGERRVLTKDITSDAEEFDLSPDGKTIALFTNEDGGGVLRLIDVASGRELPRPKLPLGVPAGLDD